MKMNKVFLSLLASATAFTLGSQTSQASASTWHQGVPSEIRGYWRSKAKYLKGLNAYERNEVNFSSDEANYYFIVTADPFATKNIKYKYDGNNTYSIKGMDYEQDAYIKIHDYYKIHLYNHNKMKIYLKKTGSNENIFHVDPILNRTSKKHIYEELR